MNQPLQAEQQRVQSTDISLVFDQVTKKYGRVVAVDNVSFDVMRGELLPES